jgi:hypothetical protein
MVKPELRLVPTWSKPLSNEGLPSVIRAPAYDQHGFPVVQTWEKSVGEWTNCDQV